MDVMLFGTDAMFLGASYGELSLFVLAFLALIATWVHFLRWQRRVMLMLHAIQTQVQDATFSHQRLHDDMIKKITEEVGEQAQTLAQFFQPSNFAESAKMVVDQLHGLQENLHKAAMTASTSTTTAVSLKDLNTEINVVRKQLLEALGQTAGIKSLASEVTTMHKALATVVENCGKLGGFYNRITEMHGQVQQTATSKTQEVALGNVLKTLLETLERLQNTLQRKLEDILEKTTITRVILDQRADKILVAVKDATGPLSSNLREIIGQIRGLLPLVPETKKLLEMVDAGRHASTLAQGTLQSSTEAVQGCEDRLVRLEPLITGLIDQVNEADDRVRHGFEAVNNELPQLAEILARLPKLPPRRPPPTDRNSGDSAASGGSQQAPPPQHPTTPPTTLGPSQPQIPVAAQPQLVPNTGAGIPVTIDGNGGGIQLRLSEHVNPTVPSPLGQVYFQGGESRPQNFVITPLPQTRGPADLASALLFQQR